MMEKLLTHIENLSDQQGDIKNYKIKTTLRKLSEINNSLLIDNFLSINQFVEKESKFKKFSEKIDELNSL